MRNNSTKKMVFAAVGIAINIILGIFVGGLKIPLLFMDTVGTVFTAVVLGPLWGACTGALTNVILGVLKDPREIPFLLVNLVVGLIVGFIAKKRKFDLKTAVVTGIILSIVAPLIGTPIAVFVYGGITGDFNDVFFTALKNSGQTIFSAAFLPRVASNLVDKIITCSIVSLLYKRVKSML